MVKVPDSAPTSAVEVQAFDLKNVETRRRNQHDSGLWVQSPAMADWTALGTKRLAKLSIAMGDQTEHPTTCLVVAAPDGNGLYFIPGIDHEQAIEVKYADGRARMNLLKVFTILDKLVAPGIREFFPLERPDHAVSFEGKEYRALIMLPEKTATRRLKGNKSKKKAPEPAQAEQPAAAEESK